MYHAINEYQLRLDVQHFLWSVYYIAILFTQVLDFASWGVTSITASQDAHKRLVMQVAEWLTASLYQCSREVSDMS